jgi:arylsulfatase
MVATVVAQLSTGLQAREIVRDPEFVRMEKEFGEQWRADDKLVREKLAALEARFGKKPNIVYILADDVGYTELGSYGGGKLRGAPTPSLDKMARQGMRFLNFYSEVECSPSRGALMTGRHPIRNGLYNITLPGEVGTGLHGDEVTTAEIL